MNKTHRGWSKDNKTCPVCKGDREFETYQAFRAHWEAKHRGPQNDEEKRYPLSIPRNLQKDWAKIRKITQNGVIVTALRRYKSAKFGQQMVWLDSKGNEYDKCPVDDCNFFVKRKQEGIPDREAMIEHNLEEHNIEKEKKRMRSIIVKDIIRVWNNLRRPPRFSEYILRTNLAKTEILRNVDDADKGAVLKEKLDFVGGWEYLIQTEIGVHHIEKINPYRKPRSYEPHFINDDIPSDPFLSIVEEERKRSNKRQIDFQKAVGISKKEFKEKATGEQRDEVKKIKDPIELTLMRAIKRAKRRKVPYFPNKKGTQSVDEIDISDEDEDTDIDVRIEPIHLSEKDIYEARKMIIKRNLKAIAHEFMFLRSRSTKGEQFGKPTLASNERDRFEASREYVTEKLSRYAMYKGEPVLVVYGVICPKCGDFMPYHRFKEAYYCRNCKTDKGKTFTLAIPDRPLEFYTVKTKKKTIQIPYLRTNIRKKIRREYRIRYGSNPDERYITEILKEKLPSIDMLHTVKFHHTLRRVDAEEIYRNKKERKKIHESVNLHPGFRYMETNDEWKNKVPKAEDEIPYSISELYAISKTKRRIERGG